jgi:hypothetical protein
MNLADVSRYYKNRYPAATLSLTRATDRVPTARIGVPFRYRGGRDVFLITIEEIQSERDPSPLKVDMTLEFAFRDLPSEQQEYLTVPMPR